MTGTALPTFRRILGIDPGYAALGYGVLTKEGARWRHVLSGVEKTPAALHIDTRLHGIWVRLQAMPPVELVAIEDQAGAYEGKRRKERTGAAQLFVREVVGMVKALAFERAARLVVVDPQRLRALLLGKGNRSADKATVARAVRFLVPGAPPVMQDHASDALSVAIAGERIAVGEGIVRR